jgi:ATP-dependent protease ClpP protease subunit
VEGCKSVLKTVDNYKGHLKTLHRNAANLKELLKEALGMEPDFYMSAEDAARQGLI